MRTYATDVATDRFAPRAAIPATVSLMVMQQQQQRLQGVTVGSAEDCKPWWMRSQPVV
jgi:hypothetical protein